MIKVKMPNLATGWAWLSEEDFKKPKPDGGKWELWKEKSGAYATKAEETADADVQKDKTEDTSSYPKSARRGM